MPFQKGHDGFGQGGKRPNAGRKPNVARELEQKIIGKVATPAKLERLLVKLFELSESDDPKVSADAIGRILDRVFGKAPQRTELAGDNGGPVKLQVDVMLE